MDNNCSDLDQWSESKRNTPIVLRADSTTNHKSVVHPRWHVWYNCEPLHGSSPRSCQTDDIFFLLPLVSANFFHSQLKLTSFFFFFFIGWQFIEISQQLLWHALILCLRETAADAGGHNTLTIMKRRGATVLTSNPNTGISKRGHRCLTHVPSHTRGLL